MGGLAVAGRIYNMLFCYVLAHQSEVLPKVPLLLFRPANIKSSYKAAKNWTLGTQLSLLQQQSHFYRDKHLDGFCVL